MLPLQDHGKCKKAQLREFEKIATIESVGAFRPTLIFIFAWGQAKFLIWGILINVKYELFFIIKITLKVFI